MKKLGSFDAYQVFFPVALLFGILGTLLWVAFWAQKLTTYPGATHANLMIGGFQFYFALGFLGTAVPRLSGTQGMSSRETVLALAIAAIALFGFLAGYSLLAYSAMIAALSQLGYFMASRFRKSGRRPPGLFVLALFGLGFGWLGLLLLLSSEIFPSGPAAFAGLGKGLFLHGMMFCLTLGVGSFLMPVIFGWRETVQPKPTDEESGTWGFSQGFVFGIVILLSFILDVLYTPWVGRTLRALIAVILAVKAWRIHRLPRLRTGYAWCVWVGCWSFVAGTVLYAASPEFAIHAVHLQFVGGYTLLMLGVASRVILAHGGHSLMLEKGKRMIWIAIWLFLFAALTRLFAPIVPRLYFSHLAYASLTWIAGVAVWGYLFLPLFKPNKH